MDAAALLDRAAAEFRARVHAIGDRWAAPTPCAGWDVRTLVAHVLEEQRWAPPLLAGRTIAEVGDTLSGDLLGADPVASLDAATPPMLAAAAAPVPTVHLSFGDVPAEEYAMQLAADHLVHAWDLGVALGAEPALDPTAVQAVGAWFTDAEPLYRQAGLIGPRVPLPSGASPQEELLAAFGRAGTRTAVARFGAAFDARDVDAVMAAMTADCVFEDTAPPDGRRHEGPAAVRAAWEALFSSSPGAVFAAEETVVAGDRAVVRWRYDWGDGHVRGVDVFTVRDGLVAEKLSYVKG